MVEPGPMFQPDQPHDDRAERVVPSVLLATGRGRTTVAGPVVEKIAAAAASLVPGVNRVGGGSGGALGTIRDIIPGTRSAGAPGASAEVGLTQAAIDLGVSLDYGVSVAEVAGGIRATVIGAVQAMTGLEVVQVNVQVQDLHLTDDVVPSPEG